MAKKNLTDRQKRSRRRHREKYGRVMFALEIIVLVVLMGGLLYMRNLES